MRRLSPRRLGLRARLTLAIGTLFLVAGAGLLLTTYTLVDQQLDERPLIDVDSTTPPPGPASDDPGFTVRDQDGKIYAGEEAVHRLDVEQEEIRTEAAHTVLTQGAAALVIVGGIAVALVWLVSGRILDPLRRMTATARRIAAAPAAHQGLHERIELTGRQDEVHDLGESFDTMLERLDVAFASQRRFVANASHELRTPLTVNRALIEVALHEPEVPASTRSLAENLMRVNDQQRRLIDGLLLLAKAEHEVVDRAPIDIADLVDHVVAQIDREAADAGVRIEVDLSEAVTRGDALLLERLVYNLVENAIRYNDRGGWVRVACRPCENTWVELAVSNTGPVLTSYQAGELWEPFRRLDSERLAGSGGAGLGLSIVRSITQAHGGTVDSRPREQGGLELIVTLPADDQT